MQVAKAYRLYDEISLSKRHSCISFLCMVLDLIKLYINTYQGENAVPLMKVAANEQTCMLLPPLTYSFHGEECGLH